MASSNPLEWPEAVVPVQTLSGSGMSTVPRQYIKPPSERPSGSTNDPNLKIPVIDLASFSNAPDHHQAMLEIVADACKDWGFFQVVNHDVDMEVVKRMRGAWREFFALPMEEKKVYANLPVTYEGYGSRLGVEKEAILDWNDYYFLNLFPSDIRNLDKWPKIPTDLRETTEKYACQLISLCQVLLKAVSSSLGLEEDYLLSAFGGTDGISATMRANYYPRCPQPELTLGISAHSDPGGITLLLADDNVEGTQVRKGDSWVTVQPVPGSFLVNVGDQIQILSNGRYRSVEHRALANSDEDRHTIAFFCNPRGDLPIAPASELVHPESLALYQKAVTFNDYRKYIRTKGPSGRMQIQSINSTMQPEPAA
ncbi:jasmonate-induced oxygenase 4-like [Lolium rigidum]|uniref:jasmonate-induced oxygenase 4-like n=1 Tax=Lolium rigidum TaxID=89674 RepID=UPI001F5E2882|nr:jasmonate-induced oxygenase 4-like [Lolium rigidum]